MLEDRTLPAVSAQLVGQALLVTADAAQDAIRVQGNSANQTIQVIDQTGSVVGAFPSAAVAAVNVSGGSVEIDGTLNLSGGLRVSADSIEMAGTVASGSMVRLVSTGSVTFDGGASLSAPGQNVSIIDGGDFIAQAGSQLDVSATATYLAGVLSVQANRIGLAGLLAANGAGGQVQLNAAGATVMAPTSTIQANGGNVNVNASANLLGAADQSSVSMYEGATIDTGAGGSVDLSGGTLNVDAGTVQTGHLLFDPTNIQFRNDVPETGTTGFSGFTEAFAADPGATSVFHTDGTGILAHSGVTSGATITFQATNDIQVMDDFTLQTATNAPNVTLVLQADNDVQVGGMITANGTGAVSLEADADANDTGQISITAGGVTTANQSINLTGANVVISGSASVNAGTGNVAFTSADPNATIATGIENGIPYSISNDTLSHVTTTGTIVVGDAHHLGDINVMKNEVVDQASDNFLLITEGNIALGQYNFYANNLTLQAGGLIRLPGGGLLTANTITATANNGIVMNTLASGGITPTVTASNGGTGDVQIIGSGDLNVPKVIDQDGSVTIQTTGGDLTIGTITANGSGSNIGLSTQTSGNLDLSGKLAATNNITLTTATSGQVNYGTGTSFQLGGQATANGAPINNNVTPITQTLHIFATGADAGGGPQVVVYNSDTLQPIFSFFAYSPTFTGGVRVAVGDLTGDGTPDIITAPGPGGGPQINVYSGVTGQLLYTFFAYNPNFIDGVFIAAGDLSGNGADDIICGTDSGGGPNVTVFSASNQGQTPVMSFFAYNPAFTGGVRVAAGDLSGQGYDDIICGAGPGGGPNVTVFDGKSGAAVDSFFAYNPAFSPGIFVASGDIGGNGHADIITGAGPGGGPNVTVFDGITDQPIINYFPYDPGLVVGVRVGAVARNATETDILTVPGPGGGPEVTMFQDVNGTPTPVQQFFPINPLFSGGLFIAGGG